jgi:hypothetical protein
MNTEEKKYKQFFEDFEEWVHTQIDVFTMAAETAQKVIDEDGENLDAEAAILTYNSRVDVYQYLTTKFDNLRQGKNFHDLPDGLLDQNKKYYR